MPLDNCIYSSSQDKLFGVRGQYVYKFNATTGAKESEFRFVNDVIFGESYIVELGGFLYISTWRVALEDQATNYPAGQDIFKVNYALTSSVGLGLPNELKFPDGDYPNDTFSFFGAGFSNLVTDGTYIWGVECVRTQGMFKVDPTNVTAAEGDNNISPTGNCINDVAHDAVNGILWVSTQNDLGFCGKDDLGFDTMFSSDSDASVRLLGVCIVPGATPKVYYVSGTNVIYKPNVTAAYAALPANLSSYTTASLAILQGDAKPMRIRYNPNDGLVYIPTWSKDQVEIMDPSTDTITAVKTGFTNVIDCVFTPTKKWGVQNSSVGLKEIT